MRQTVALLQQETGALQEELTVLEMGVERLQQQAGQLALRISSYVKENTNAV